MSNDLPSDLIPPAVAVEIEPFTAEDVDGWTSDPDSLPETARRWSVTDLGSAEWAMAQVAGADDQLAEARELAQAQIARINRWLDGETARLTGRRDFFAGKLIEFAEARRRIDPRNNKTLRLPSGDVKSSEAKPAVVVEDEVTLAEWARPFGDEVVEFRPKVFVRELRKLAEIAELQTGWDIELGCGCLITGPVADEDGEPIDVDGPTFPCPTCEESVDLVSAEPVVEMVAVDENGYPIPGAGVKAGGVSFSVKPS